MLKVGLCSYDVQCNGFLNTTMPLKTKSIIYFPPMLVNSAIPGFINWLVEMVAIPTQNKEKPWTI